MILFKAFRLSQFFFISVSLFGCAPYIPSIRYEPTHKLIANPTIRANVVIGKFIDNRNTDLYWLGAVRNGFGAVVKKLITKQPTSEIIQAAIEQALETRNIISSDQNPEIIIEGSILKFDCSTMVNYEVHANLMVNVLLLPSRSLIYSNLYRTDKVESGFGGGLYGGYKDLALLAQNALNETIDKVFADPVMITALKNPPNTLETTNKRSISQRLKELEAIKANGLISDTEYQSKRRELLDKL